MDLISSSIIKSYPLRRAAQASLISVKLTHQAGHLCRDTGWCGADAGALCLSCVPARFPHPSALPLLVPTTNPTIVLDPNLTPMGARFIAPVLAGWLSTLPLPHPQTKLPAQARVSHAPDHPLAAK